MRLERPELCIFDVDGTLNGIELWWPDLIREGIAGFADEMGLDLLPPDDRAALAVVGEKNEGVWTPFLPPEHQHLWSQLRARVLPMEVELLRSGRDFLYPGIRELLVHLRSLGVKLALASNCGAEYMAAIAEGQGLARLTDWLFCLASPGVTEKADMLRLALEAAATRRAVMVGDRPSDQAAARANHLPFLWRSNDLCRIPDAEGVWDGEPDSLLALLGLPRISSGGGA